MDTQRGLLVSIVEMLLIHLRFIFRRKELVLGSGKQRAMEVKTNTFCAVSSTIVIHSLY
jgi:hypothetical protein